MKAAVREVDEETGVRLDPDTNVPPMALMHVHNTVPPPTGGKRTYPFPDSFMAFFYHPSLEPKAIAPFAKFHDETQERGWFRMEEIRAMKQKEWHKLYEVALSRREKDLADVASTVDRQ